MNERLTAGDLVETANALSVALREGVSLEECCRRVLHTFARVTSPAGARVLPEAISRLRAHALEAMRDAQSGKEDGVDYAGYSAFLSDAVAAYDALSVELAAVTRERDAMREKAFHHEQAWKIALDEMDAICKALAPTMPEALSCRPREQVQRLIREREILRGADAAAREAKAFPGTVYRAREDMGESQLSVVVEDDGDVCLAVCDDEGMHGVQFCIPGTGGGKSPLIYAALRKLADAMHQTSTARRAGERQE